MPVSIETVLSILIAAASWLAAPAQAATGRGPTVRPAPSARAAARAETYVRATGDRFEIVRGGVAHPVFFRGVNL
ncbi:MAG TPA: hypothetical protein VL503_05155, partial [Candidatus Omnitrophota bacterium]|nr:hypothetical protein [Candidatus Omnitrophota bacterium]